MTSSLRNPASCS
uniref:Uncharacterized protein n=1 Tax=Arundo donax TaxID=35708 RepID=A0A0A8Z5B2_ARUDO